MSYECSCDEVDNRVGKMLIELLEGLTQQLLELFPRQLLDELLYDVDPEKLLFTVLALVAFIFVFARLFRG